MRLLSTIIILLFEHFDLHHAALSCYQCGTHGQDGYDCDTMRTSRYWIPFVAECLEGQICSKVSTYSNGTFQEVRSCSFDETYYGSKHLIGCDIAERGNQDILMCFCSTNLCNRAPATTLSNLTAVVITTMVISTLVNKVLC